MPLPEQRRRQQRSALLQRALDALHSERERLEVAIGAAGGRREEALQQATAELETIGDLAVDALDAGSRPGDLAAKAGISTRTLYKLLDARDYQRHRE